MKSWHELPQLLSPRSLAWLWTGAVSLLLMFWMAGWGYDDPYITYRYSQNIADGVGFVYNPGEQILSTTTPLYALILAFFRIANMHLPTVSLGIGAVSLALSGLALWELGQRWGSPVAAWSGLLTLPFFPLLVSTLGSETPLAVALVLWGSVAYVGRRYSWAAALLALAILCRPDSGLMAGILAGHFLIWEWWRGRQPLAWRALAVGGAILLAWGLFAGFYFGSPLPVTLAAKQAQGVLQISQSYWVGLGLMAGQYGNAKGYWLLAALALAGTLGVMRRPHWLLILAWSAGHLAAYSLLGVTRYFWYYAQLVPGLLVLVALGVEESGRWLGRWLGQRTVLGLGIVLTLAVVGVELRSVSVMARQPDPRLGIYRETGEWLANNTPAGATVGTLEVGIIGYYAQRPMVDFAGLLQPEVVAAFTPTSTYDDISLWAIQRYLPDYLVVQAGSLPRVEADPRVAAACGLVQTVQRDDFPAPMLILGCQW